MTGCHALATTACGVPGFLCEMQNLRLPEHASNHIDVRNNQGNPLNTCKQLLSAA